MGGRHARKDPARPTHWDCHRRPRLPAGDSRDARSASLIHARRVHLHRSWMESCEDDEARSQAASAERLQIARNGAHRNARPDRRDESRERRKFSHVPSRELTNREDLLTGLRDDQIACPLLHEIETAERESPVGLHDLSRMFGGAKQNSRERRGGVRVLGSREGLPETQPIVGRVWHSSVRSRVAANRRSRWGESIARGSRRPVWTNGCT